MRHKYVFCRYLSSKIARSALLLHKPQQYNFRLCPESHRWLPGAGAAAGVNEHAFKLIQAVNKLPMHSRGHPTPGQDLTLVGMAGKLERDPRFFCNIQKLRNVA